MTSKQVRFLVEGDLVYGMANSVMPFVGKVGDATGARTKEIGGAMAKASDSGGGTPGKCKVTINGKPVATADSIANNEGAPVPIEARPLGFTKSIFVDGKPLLLHGGPFMAYPDGSLQGMAVQQQVVHGPLVAGPDGSFGDEPPPPPPPGSSMAGSGIARTNWDEPSAEHTMISRCSSARLADLLPPEYAVLVGDPVDVSTGAVVTSAVDDAWVSPALAFERHYASNRGHRDGPLGHGWSHVFDQEIWLEAGRVVLRDAGRETEFDCFGLMDQAARAGDVLFDLTGRLQLRCHGHNNWELTDGETIRHFGPTPGTSSRDRDRGLAKLTTIVRPQQPLIELHYDGGARLESVRSDGRPIFSLRYDTDDRIINLNGGVAKYQYSAAGDLIEVANLDGQARKYAYEAHLLVRETNRRGGEFFYGYEENAGRARCVRTWGTGGRLHRVISYEGDATLVTDSLGNRTIHTISASGLVTGREDAEGRSSTFTYDAALRLTEVRHPDGTREADLYDEGGHRAKHRERSGATWRMIYDGNDRLVEGFDPQGGKYLFSYDLDGRLTRVEDPLGHVTMLEYEQRRLTKIMDPLGRVTQFRLGGHDEVLALQPPTGCAVTYEYDEQGRLVLAQPDAAQEVRWHYDVAGKLVGISSEDETFQWTYDAEGSVVSVSTADSVEYLRRDLFGLLLGSRLGEVERGYLYDTEGQLIAASHDGKRRVELRRDECGMVDAYVIDRELEGEIRRSHTSGLLETLREGDVTIAVAWDEAGRLASFEAGQGERTFAYREDGLLVGYATSEHACTLERDALGTVTAQKNGDASIESRHVDHRGMRYGVDVENGPSVSYLWGSDGLLERAAISAEEPFDLGFGQSADGRQGLARHAETDLNYPLWKDGSAQVSAAAQGVDCDALHRPLMGDDGGALVWDEGRVLLEGSRLSICDPRCDRQVAIVSGATLSFVETESSGARPGAATDAALDDCRLRATDTQGGASADWAPQSMLERVFSLHAWDPQPTPIAGRAEFDPNSWHPTEPLVVEGPYRLDNETVMRLLSPFPRPKLSLPPTR